MADEGSAGVRSHGTHGRLSDKETVNADQNSCDHAKIENDLIGSDILYEK